MVAPRAGAADGRASAASDTLLRLETSEGPLELSASARHMRLRLRTDEGARYPILTEEPPTIRMEEAGKRVAPMISRPSGSRSSSSRVPHLVVPCLRAGGEVNFYMPKGGWRHFPDSDALVEGGCATTVSLALDEVAAGAQNILIP